MSEATPQGEQKEMSPYDQFCKPMFTEIKDDIKELTKETGKIKEKIFNGLSEVPGEVKAVKADIKWVHRLLITLMISIIVGGGAGLFGWVSKFTELEVKLEMISEQITEDSGRE